MQRIKAITLRKGKKRKVMAPVFKVLRLSWSSGNNWTGTNTSMTWNLPSRGKPGAWMPIIEGKMVLCVHGYHLTVSSSSVVWRWRTPRVPRGVPSTPKRSASLSVGSTPSRVTRKWYGLRQVLRSRGAAAQAHHMGRGRSTRREGEAREDGSMNAPNDDATRRLEMAKADAQAEVQQRLDEAAGKWDPFEMYTSVIDRTTGQEKPCDGFVLFANNRYHVQVRPTETKLGPMFWLSIRRNDRLPVRDWRDMQRIKNEILGEDVEGVELYSHEDRVVDTANQFHMWCLAPGLTFPFGFTEGLKLTPEEAAKLVSGARQR